jgi:hypothetical protein
VAAPSSPTVPIEILMRDMARDPRRAPFFGTPVELGPTAPASDRLIAFTGRVP